MFNFIIYFQSTTSQKEILLGNPRDFMIFKFNNRFTFFVNVLFFQKTISFVKNHFSYFKPCRIINMFVNV